MQVLSSPLFRSQRGLTIAGEIQWPEELSQTTSTLPFFERGLQSVTKNIIPSTNQIKWKTRQFESPHSYKPCCAFSYVWGKKGLEDSSDGDLLASPANLPATIEDATISTLELQIEYLWVDRYYISQQDPSEKMQEIGRMSKIYQGAYAVLIDAKGSDASHDLAGERCQTYTITTSSTTR